MAGCCPSGDYGRFFNQRFARRLANRYRKRGLDQTAQRMVQFLRQLGLEGASVLEVGGGIGEIEVELLQAGAGRAQNLELSPAYQQPARELAGQAGVQGADRLAPPRPGPRSWGGGAGRPGGPASGGVLLSGLCAAVGRGRRPCPARPGVQLSTPQPALARLYGGFNLVMRLTGSGFWGFAHPPDAMVGVLEDHGLRQTYQRRSRIWQVAGLQRVS